MSAEKPPLLGKVLLGRMVPMNVAASDALKAVKICPQCSREFSPKRREGQKDFDQRVHCSRRCYLSKMPRRFWNKVEAKGEDDCWHWKGRLSSGGYGTLCINKRAIFASHISLEFSGEPRPAISAMALHSCDNPKCVNPKHLRWGTHQDNADDRTNRKRGRFGERHSMAKLSETQVRCIKKSSQQGKVLAKQFGVCPSLISMIRLGKIWKHVP